MEATEIITVQEAKEWLSSEETDSVLTRMIKGALSWIEIYTGHTLASRTKVLQIPYSGYGISEYPIQITSVKNTAGDNLPYTYKNGVFDVYINVAPGTLVTMNVGYETKDEIPAILIEAAYKMLTYIHENRDISTLDAPVDLKLMVNKLRRNLV